MKLNKIKPGDILIADGGFTCIGIGRECRVFEAEPSSNEINITDRLYVRCCGEKPDLRTGDLTGSSNYQDRHYLNGQVDDESDEVIGFRRK